MISSLSFPGITVVLSSIFIFCVSDPLSQKLSHAWLRGRQRPDNKTLSTFPSLFHMSSFNYLLLNNFYLFYVMSFNFYKFCIFCLSSWHWNNIFLLSWFQLWIEFYLQGSEILFSIEPEISFHLLSTFLIFGHAPIFFSYWRCNLSLLGRGFSKSYFLGSVI